MESDRTLPMWHANLGRALAGKGDAAIAARTYRCVFGFHPDHAVAEEVLQTLEKLSVRADAQHDEGDDN